MFKRWFHSSKGAPQGMAQPITDRWQYRQALEALADRLPWFGEEPFEPSWDPEPGRNASQDPAYIRRVLLALLLGRPMSRVARRAGCSVRLVYEVLYRTVYFPRWGASLGWWCQLGLMGVVDGPRAAFAEEVRGSHGSPVTPEHAPVYCLVCHRLVAGVELEPRAFDGRLLRFEKDGMAFIDDPEVLEHAQAHLILHFPLGGDPIPQQAFEHKRWLIGLLAKQDARVGLPVPVPSPRVPWWERVPPIVLGLVADAQERGRGEPLPVVAGEQLSPAVARRRWEQALGHPNGPPSRPVRSGNCGGTAGRGSRRRRETG